MLNFTTYTTTSQNISFSANPNKLKIRKKDLETLSQTKTVKEIAEIYHTQTQWLYVLYKRFELQPPQKQLREKVESIIIELLRKKPSLSYICEKTGASADLVRKILKEKNIKLNEYRKQLLQKLLSSNCPDEKIAEKLDLKQKYVQSMRYKLKVSIKHINKKKKKDFAIKAYKQGVSTKEIAQQLNVNVTTVTRYIKEYKDSLKSGKS